MEVLFRVFRYLFVQQVVTRLFGIGSRAIDHQDESVCSAIRVPTSNDGNAEMEHIQPIDAPLATMRKGDVAKLSGVVRITGNPPAPAVDIELLKNLSQGSEAHKEAKFNFTEIR